MQDLFKFFLAFSLLLSPSLSFAGFPPPVTEIKIQEANTSPVVYSAYRGCLKAVQEGNLKCSKAVAEIDALQTLSATQEDQLLKARTDNSAPGMKEIGEALTSNLNKKKTALAGVQSLCTPAAANCESGCEIIAACAEAISDTAKSAGNKLACESAETMRKQCKISFAGAAELAGADLAGTNAALLRSSDVTARVTGGTPPPPEGESWFQRNGAWVVGAGLVGVGAAALLSNSGGSSGGQQYQNSPSPSPSPTPATGTGTVCTTEAEATTTTCAATFVTNCTANPAGAGCATFTSNYCGLADASSVTPSGSGAGNKTTYCRSVVSTRFCAQTGTSACVTCEYQAQMSKAICKTNIENNPTLCASQNTQTQIDAKKAACPSDPVYADNSILQTTAPNAGLDAPVLPTGTTSTVTGTGSGTGVYTGQYYSSDAEKKSGLAASSASGAASRGVASTGSTSVSSGGYGSYATASVYKGAASEITPTMGRNLFDKNSKTLQNWCYSVQCRNVGAAAN